MRNSPNSPDSRADAAFPKSPLLHRIQQLERGHSVRTIGKIVLAIAGGVALIVSAVNRIGEGNSGSGSGEFLSGPCPPGDLACLDDLYYEEHGFPFSHGTPDGCGELNLEEQLASPLCCPHVAADPSMCPPLDEIPSDGTSPDASGDPQDSEPLPGGVIEEPAPEPQPSKPELPIPPRKIDDPFGDSGSELPG